MGFFSSLKSFFANPNDSAAKPADETSMPARPPEEEQTSCEKNAEDTGPAQAAELKEPMADLRENVGDKDGENVSAPEGASDVTKPDLPEERETEGEAAEHTQALHEESLEGESLEVEVHDEAHPKEPSAEEDAARSSDSEAEGVLPSAEGEAVEHTQALHKESLKESLEDEVQDNAHPKELSAEEEAEVFADAAADARAEGDVSSDEGEAAEHTQVLHEESLKESLEDEVHDEAHPKESSAEEDAARSSIARAEGMLLSDEGEAAEHTQALQKESQEESLDDSQEVHDEAHPKESSAKTDADRFAEGAAEGDVPSDAQKGAVFEEENDLHVKGQEDKIHPEESIGDVVPAEKPAKSKASTGFFAGLKSFFKGPEQAVDVPPVPQQISPTRESASAEQVLQEEPLQEESLEGSQEVEAQDEARPKEPSVEPEAESAEGAAEGVLPADKEDEAQHAQALHEESQEEPLDGEVQDEVCPKEPSVEPEVEVLAEGAADGVLPSEQGEDAQHAQALLEESQEESLDGEVQDEVCPKEPSVEPEVEVLAEGAAEGVLPSDEGDDAQRKPALREESPQESLDSEVQDETHPKEPSVEPEAEGLAEGAAEGVLPAEAQKGAVLERENERTAQATSEVAEEEKREGGFFSRLKRFFVFQEKTDKEALVAKASQETARAEKADERSEPTAEEEQLIVALRKAQPKLSQWLAIVLDGVEEAGDKLYDRLRFLLKSLEAPSDEIERFVLDFKAWVESMEYVYVEEFRSELQYRLALALKLEDEEDEQNRLFIKIRSGLAKTRENLSRKLDALVASHGTLDEVFWEHMEEVFITADLGYDAALTLVERLKRRARDHGETDSSAVLALLREELDEIFRIEPHITAYTAPEVVLMVGVNGVGKTTTIGKLAHRARMQGRRVMICAADTFRAAAIEQLEVWASRSGALFYAKQPGADPASVAFEALDHAKKEGADLLFIDTAGRLQTKTNLMSELHKIKTVVAKRHPGAPHRTVLVIDATTGQNALSQVKLFKEASGVDELIVTKLDGTAKGGFAIALALQYHLPISFIGLGEKLEDLRPFNGREFANGLLEGARVETNPAN